MNRVLVFLLALGVVVGVAAVAFFIFDDSGGKSKGVDIGGPAAKGPPVQAPAPPTGGPITGRLPETGPIKSTSYADTPGAFHDAGIMGVVQNEAGARIQDAVVELFEDTSALKDRTQEGELRNRQNTNSEGLFFFDRNALSLAERYLLKIAHPMFMTERKPVDVRRPDGGVVYVTLRSGVAISGTVRNVAGAGIPNATVSVFDLTQNTVDPNGSVETWVTSDSTGFYTIGHASAGMKRIQASSENHATSARQGVNIEGGKPLTNVDFTLNEGATISGQLIASDGTFVGGAFVTARPVRIGARPDAEAMAKDAAAAGRAEAKIREHAVRVGDAAAREAQEEEEVKKMPGRDEGKEAMLQKELQAREAEGRKESAPGPKQRPPVPTQPVYMSTLSVRSQADGTYTITGVEIGSYIVSVNVPGYMPPAQQPVETPAQGVNFTLQPNARIIGRVVDDETSKPVSMFSVGLTTNPEDVMIPAYSKKLFGPPKHNDGHFEYVDVKPGKFWLLADAAGYAGGRSTEIAVSQGERREGVEIRLVRGGTVKGRVVDAKGVGISDATVQPEQATTAGNLANPFIGVLTQSMRRDVREVRTDSEGRFILPNLLGGSYTLNIKHKDFGPQVTAAFTVGNSGETMHPDVVLSRGASIHGLVRLADGQPDTKAMVQVSPVGGTPNFTGHRSAYTNAEGRYEVTGLAVGQYRVIAAQRNGQPDIGSLFKGLAQGQTQNLVTVAEGETKELDL
jgi:hypothetical protein